MAERVGFEPTIPFQVCPLSRRIVSTTHAPLRIKIVSDDRERDRPALSLISLHSHPPIAKKILDERRALLPQNSSRNLHLMVQQRMVYDLHH